MSTGTSVSIIINLSLILIRISKKILFDTFLGAKIEQKGAGNMKKYFGLNLKAYLVKLIKVSFMSGNNVILLFLF